MIPLAGNSRLPWALRPEQLRRRVALRPLWNVLAVVLALYLGLRLQCACWRAQAERYLCPSPTEKPAW